MRIDAHHSSSGPHPVEYLETILKRNRFERSIFVGQPRPLPAFVAGIVVPAGASVDDPRVCGVQISHMDQLDKAPPDLPLDLLGLLPEVPAIARRFPGRSLLIDHMGYPPSESWPDDLARAAALPNVYCKLSGVTRFGDPRPFVQRALALFGPERLMFGSDWPNGLPEHTWKATLAAFTQAIGAQTIQVREQLLGETAARVYRLPQSRED